MNRLIDTMTNEKAHDLVEYLADVNVRVVEAIDVLENLFKPVPHWSDNLDPQDDQTWVFCFVSDNSPKERRYAEWISEVLDDGYRGPEGLAWTHATPVDLNLRYKEGG